MVRQADRTPDVPGDTMTVEELARGLGIGLTSAYLKAQRDALPIPRIPGMSRHRFSRRLYEQLLAGEYVRPGHGDDDRAA